MAGQMTPRKAEWYWNNFNRDENDEVLSVDEVKQCLEEAFGTVEDTDVEEKYAFFGQKEVKNLTKDEFIKGLLQTDKCCQLKQLFISLDTDKSGFLTKDELTNGLSESGIMTKEQAEVVLDEVDEDPDKKFDCDEFISAYRFSEFFTQSYKC